MIVFALVLTALPVLIGAYAYVVYPLILVLLRAVSVRPRPVGPLDDASYSWPEITITLPVYNEEQVIAQRINNLLALDYPPEKRRLLVLSDASTDRTDEIVRSFADQGVQLLRLEVRAGKSAAENAAAAHLRGELVVNVDATTVVYPQSLKALVRAFSDPTVGVASGRDVSLGVSNREMNRGESGYVGYEMWVRELETQLEGIVGASGCFYGIRATIYEGNFPLRLSRDFASPLIAREHGYKAVSVGGALCGVPRVPALQAEYKRKIRTMHRGLETLWHMRHLMSPREGLFAFKLVSHKLMRWLVYPSLVPAAIGLVLLSVLWPPAIGLVVLSILVVALGVVALRWPAGRPIPSWISLPGFFVASNLAGLQAWMRPFKSGGDASWEPTRRTA